MQLKPRRWGELLNHEKDHYYNHAIHLQERGMFPSANMYDLAEHIFNKQEQERVNNANQSNQEVGDSSSS